MIDDKQFEAFMLAMHEHGPTGLGYKKALEAYEQSKQPSEGVDAKCPQCDELRSKPDYENGAIEQLAFELAWELEEADLKVDDLVTVNKAKLHAIATRVYHRLRTKQPEREELEWRPIDSAPKDGSQFLIYTKRVEFSVVTHDVENPMPANIAPSGLHLQVDDGKFGPYPLRGDYPTHWMPLPNPPTASNKEE